MPETDAVGNYVRLTRLIRAPREKVYDAWLDPAVRQLWWCASPEMKAGRCEIDAKVGGQYAVGMIGPDGTEYVARGEFMTLDRPSRIQFTWTWDHDPAFGGNSQVTIDFHETTHHDAPATELVLLHERLDTPHARSEHTTGWLGCLRALGGHFAALADQARP